MIVRPTRSTRTYTLFPNTALFRSTAKAAADWLFSVLAMADFAAPYEFLETILSGPLDGRRRLLARLGEEACDPIDELLNAALAFEAANLPSLQGFLDWIEREAVEVNRDPSRQREDRQWVV